MGTNQQSICRSIKSPKQKAATLKVSEIRRGPSLAEMVYLPGGDFLMGNDHSEEFLKDKEGPIRNVKVKPFYIDKFAITNEKFMAFVGETAYKTEAEQFGWSFVFYSFLTEDVAKKVKQTVAETPWWAVVEGAYWRAPEGPDSTIKNRLNHPVVHISWNDALAYCQWSGKRLPTEEEWEYAARGGLIQKKYPWGNDLLVEGKHQCNIWQGPFPNDNTAEDGYVGTAPVDEFPPNHYGLYNMTGNVWEWCAGDQEDFEASSNTGINTMKGGSYLCHESYCNRYRVAAKTFNTSDSSTGNIGFRCVIDSPYQVYYSDN